MHYYYTVNPYIRNMQEEGRVLGGGLGFRA
jgi:hypothetical protein